MAGPLHFVGLVGLVAITGIAVARGFSRPTWKRGGAAALAALASSTLVCLGLHGCDAGQPLVQWAAPALCLVVCILFVGDPRARLGLAAGAVAVMLGLTIHYLSVVHGSDWIGNPRSHALGEQRGIAEWHTPVTRLWRRPPVALTDG
jgi:hypothetical protein